MLKQLSLGTTVKSRKPELPSERLKLFRLKKFRDIARLEHIGVSYRAKQKQLMLRQVRVIGNSSYRDYSVKEFLMFACIIRKSLNNRQKFLPRFLSSCQSIHCTTDSNYVVSTVSGIQVLHICVTYLHLLVLETLQDIKELNQSHLLRSSGMWMRFTSNQLPYRN